MVSLLEYKFVTPAFPFIMLKLVDEDVAKTSIKTVMTSLIHNARKIINAVCETDFCTIKKSSQIA